MLYFNTLEEEMTGCIWVKLKINKIIPKEDEVPWAENKKRSNWKKQIEFNYRFSINQFTFILFMDSVSFSNRSLSKLCFPSHNFHFHILCYWWSPKHDLGNQICFARKSGKFYQSQGILVSILILGIPYSPFSHLFCSNDASTQTPRIAIFHGYCCWSS